MPGCGPYRLWLAVGVLDLVVFALEARGGLGPHQANNLTGFAQAPDALASGVYQLFLNYPHSLNTGLGENWLIHDLDYLLLCHSLICYHIHHFPT